MFPFTLKEAGHNALICTKALTTDLEHRNLRNTVDDKRTAIKHAYYAVFPIVVFEFAHNDVILILINRLLIPLSAAKSGRGNPAFAYVH